jgi:MFS family permease
MRPQIGILILATSLVQFGNGFFGTFISLRIVKEAFDPAMTGLVLSSYFAGFAIAATQSGKMIGRIGHIRAYAAFAGLVVCGTAVMPLLVDPIAWIVLRAVIGFGCAGLFVATESWLNAKAAPSERGRVFSLYMVGTFLALALGQVLIGQIDVATEAPFSAIVVLFALALVMVSTMRAEPPAITAAAGLPYGLLTRAAPVAVFGCALSGIITSTFYALVPAWMQDEGIGQQTIALFMLVAVLGGFAFQVPVGRLSDRFDRRVVLAMIAAGAAASAGALLATPHVLAAVLPFAALLGGFMSRLYPICVAHAHDRMPQDRVVAVSGRMILISGVGSVIGPLAGSVLKPALGIDGVLLLIAGAAILIALLAAGRSIIKVAPRHLRRPFALLTPQATSLAHDAYDQDAVSERQAA